MRLLSRGVMPFLPHREYSRSGPGNTELYRVKEPPGARTADARQAAPKVPRRGKPEHHRIKW
jgi:hypothetical protein